MVIFKNILSIYVQSFEEWLSSDLPLNIKDTVCIYEDIFFESCFALKVNIEVFCYF